MLEHKTSRGRESAGVCTAARSPAGTQVKKDESAVSPSTTRDFNRPEARLSSSGFRVSRTYNLRP